MGNRLFPRPGRLHSFILLVQASKWARGYPQLRPVRLGMFGGDLVSRDGQDASTVARYALGRVSSASSLLDQQVRFAASPRQPQHEASPYKSLLDHLMKQIRRLNRIFHSINGHRDCHFRINGGSRRIGCPSWLAGCAETNLTEAGEVYVAIEVRVSF